MTGPPGRRAVALEIAVSSPAGALAACSGGADRVELCTALELDGLTPSPATLEGALEAGLDVHVLVRPRPGDFVYDDSELVTALSDVVHVLRAGARGVVVGALRPSGGLDVAFLAAVARAAREVRADAEVTLHRAVDRLARPSGHVGVLASLGVTRVLTSGARAAAPDGAAELARMVAAAGPVQVMAGGGVTPRSVAALVATGVAAVHLSAKRPAAGTWVTDAGVVAAARAALDAALAARGPW